MNKDNNIYLITLPLSVSWLGPVESARTLSALFPAPSSRTVSSGEFVAEPGCTY